MNIIEPILWVIIILFSSVGIALAIKGNNKKPKVEEKRDTILPLHDSYSTMMQMEIFTDTIRHLKIQLENTMEENLKYVKTCKELTFENINLKKALKHWTDPEKVEFT